MSLVIASRRLDSGYASRNLTVSGGDPSPELTR